MRKTEDLAPCRCTPFSVLFFGFLQKAAEIDIAAEIVVQYLRTFWQWQPSVSSVQHVWGLTQADLLVMHLLVAGSQSIMYGGLFPIPGDPNLAPSRRISTSRPESVRLAQLGWLGSINRCASTGRGSSSEIPGSKRRLCGSSLRRQAPSVALIAVSTSLCFMARAVSILRKL